jgi:hypothetical protein
MTPRTALAEVYGAIQADDILAALKRAGWIVVRHDAIRLAQAHARAEVNDNNCVRKAA